MQEAKAKTVLAVDVGSNTTKCLLARKDAGGIVLPLWEASKPNRICRGAGLSPDAALRTAECINEFVRLAGERAGSFEIRCVGTSALRSAPDGELAAQKISQNCPAKLKIISGQTEALLSFTGAASDPALPRTPANLLFMDIGGGSLELVCGKREKELTHLLKRQSFPIGAVRLEERFSLSGQNGIPQDEKISECESFCLNALSEWKLPPAGEDIILSGSGGALSAARIICARAAGTDAQSSSNRLYINKLEALLKEMLPLCVDERAERYSMDRNRADILPAALVCVISAMKYLGQREIFHTFRSLRYGLALVDDFSSLK